MTIKNNDDVANLLNATGRLGTPYREFESTTDQMSAPLIDAIFGKDLPPTAREEAPLAVGTASGNDLLADVFDHSTGIGGARPADRGAWRDEAFQQAAGMARPPASSARGPHRTLADIRRIISQPVGEAGQPPPTGGLNGLFDRLAR